jgi:5-hydroxyisourate hydrolase
MGQLTTHVLDLATGVPAANLRIELHAERQGHAPVLVAAGVTAETGRLAAPLLSGPTMHSGRYTLTFHLAEYFRGRGMTLPDPAFIERATISVGIAHPDQHYHVPLLITPWSYSVYRGG